MNYILSLIPPILLQNHYLGMVSYHIKYTENQLNIYPGNEYQSPCADTLESCNNNISPIDPNNLM